MKKHDIEFVATITVKGKDTEVGIHTSVLSLNKTLDKEVFSKELMELMMVHGIVLLTASVATEE